MKICAIGLGKLGLPLAEVWARAGHKVIGVDQNLDIAKKVNDGVSPHLEPGLEKLHIRAATRSLEVVPDVDMVFVVVNTTRSLDGFWDLVGSLQPIVKKNQLLVITSTVPPETTSRVASMVQCAVCYNPLFVRLGSVLDDILKPQIILIGSTKLSWAEELSYKWREVAPATSDRVFITVPPQAAEVAKLALNAWLCTKISFGNVLAETCERFGVDAKAVLGILGHDSRVNTKYMSPGLGFGGPCFPPDLLAFNRLADSDILREVHRYNETLPGRLAAKIAARTQGPIAVLGLTYKPRVPVTDESQAVMLVGELKRRGIAVKTYDPTVGGNCPSLAECLDGVEAVVISTPYPEFADIDFGDRLVFDPWEIM